MFKGQGNRKRTCKNCGKTKIPACDGFIVGVNFVCSRDCAFQLGNKAAQKSTAKAKAKIDRKAREDEKKANTNRRERKESLKTLTQLKAEAQKVFNRYIRLSDPFTDCASCDRSPEEIQANDGWKTGGCWDAGHFHSRGARPDLRFTEDNVWRQCKSCNAGSGKYSAKNQTVQNRYREKLIERIGIERVEELDVDLGPHKWTKDELREIIATYKAKCKESNKGA